MAGVWGLGKPRRRSAGGASARRWPRQLLVAAPARPNSTGSPSLSPTATSPSSTQISQLQGKLGSEEYITTDRLPPHPAAHVVVALQSLFRAKSMQEICDNMGERVGPWILDADGMGVR